VPAAVAVPVACVQRLLCVCSGGAPALSDHHRHPEHPHCSVRNARSLDLF